MRLSFITKFIVQVLTAAATTAQWKQEAFQARARRHLLRPQQRLSRAMRISQGHANVYRSKTPIHQTSTSASLCTVCIFLFWCAYVWMYLRARPHTHTRKSSKVMLPIYFPRNCNWYMEHNNTVWWIKVTVTKQVTISDCIFTSAFHFTDWQLCRVYPKRGYRPCWHCQIVLANTFWFS